MSNRQEEEFYRQKYLKYKAKYLEAKNQVEGGKPWLTNSCESLGIGNRGARCSISPDCKFSEGEAPSAANPTGKGPACLDKPCEKFSLASTCPDEKHNPNKNNARKPENRCKWEAEMVNGKPKTSWGREIGKCVSAAATAPAAETSSETPTSQ